MPQAHRILEKPEMNPPRYYAIKAYGIGPFPKFYDSFKNMAVVDSTLRNLKSDGYHTAEVMRDTPRVPGYFGITREIVKTVDLTKPLP